MHYILSLLINDILQYQNQPHGLKNKVHDIMEEIYEEKM